jgi:hypothetical protein
MSNKHVDAYLDSMSRNDIQGAVTHLAGSIVLLSPIFPEPFVGKESVVPILTGLIESIDALEPEFLMHSGADSSVVFTISSGEVKVKGVEHLHVDEEGLIDMIEVAWRPLPSVVLMQEKLAKTLGGQPLRLAPAE